MSSSKLGDMVAIMLIMIIGGIGLSQAASNPRQVTLRWLHLGGVLAVALVVVAGVIAAVTQANEGPGLLIFIAELGFWALVQLIAVRRGWPMVQRIAGTILFVAASMTSALILADADLWSMIQGGDVHADASKGPAANFWALAATMPPASGLLGGVLMTMLFGHAYLTAGGEMTQKPFMRLVMVLVVLIVLRMIASVLFGLWPWWSDHLAAGGAGPEMGEMWSTMLIVVRYLIGLVTPAVFTYMIWDCVRRRANQSATGILYVTLIMVVIGEGTALALVRSTGVVF